MRIIIILFFSFLFIRPLHGQVLNAPENEKLGITFSFPWVSFYHYVDYQKKSEAKKFGFFGLGFGVYYKKNETKISLNTGITDDLASPSGQINYSKLIPLTDIGTSFGELLYQHPIYRNLYFIGGFNYTAYHFHFTSGTDSIKSYTKTDDVLGLSVGLEYRFDKNFSAATVYRPMLTSFETDNFYRHVITLELRIDIDVRKIKHPL